MPDLHYNDEGNQSLEQGQAGVENLGDALSSPLRNRLRNEAAKALKPLKEKAKVKLMELATAFAEQATAAGLSGLITTIITPLVIIAIVLCILPLCLFSVSYIFNDKADSVMDNVSKAVEAAYSATKQRSVSPIMMQLNARYPVCEFDSSHIHLNEDGSIDYNSELCEIHADFEPDLAMIIPVISAYTTAVNGTLSYYNNDIQKIDSNVQLNDKGEVVGYTFNTSDLPDLNDASNYIEEDGIDEKTGLMNYKLSESIQEFIGQGFTDDTTNANSDDFRRVLQRQANSFFEIEDHIDSWGNSIRTHKFRKTRDVCFRVMKDPITGEKTVSKFSNRPCAIDSEEYFTDEEEYYVDGWKGGVSIPIYFDLTPYKKEELSRTIQAMVDSKKRCVFDINENGEFEGNDECDEREATLQVSETMYSYFATTIDYFDVDFTQASKYYMGSFGGVPGFSGMVAYNSSPINYMALAGTEVAYGHPIAQQVWGYALWLKDQGYIGGSTSNPMGGCTLFAQMWIYDVYGINQGKGGASGSGGQFAGVLVNNYPDKFQWAQGPTGGAVCSIIGAGGVNGHVIVLDEVDYEHDRIVYSEGNYNGAGGVRIRNECTFAQWNNKYKGCKKVYAAPR